MFNLFVIRKAACGLSLDQNIGFIQAASQIPPSDRRVDPIGKGGPIGKFDHDF